MFNLLYKHVKCEVCQGQMRSEMRFTELRINIKDCQLFEVAMRVSGRRVGGDRLHFLYDNNVENHQGHHSNEEIFV